jgi:hypothetical protein
MAASDLKGLLSRPDEQPEQGSELRERLLRGLSELARDYRNATRDRFGEKDIDWLVGILNCLGTLLVATEAQQTPAFAAGVRTLLDALTDDKSEVRSEAAARLESLRLSPEMEEPLAAWKRAQAASTQGGKDGSKDRHPV